MFLNQDDALGLLCFSTGSDAGPMFDVETDAVTATSGQAATLTCFVEQLGINKVEFATIILLIVIVSWTCYDSLLQTAASCMCFKQ